MNNTEAYTKEQLAAEIQRLSTTNTQLMTDKIETEKIKANLKIDRSQLFSEKNSLIAKKKELRTEIVTLNTVGSFNTPVHNH